MKFLTLLLSFILLLNTSANSNTPTFTNKDIIRDSIYAKQFPEEFLIDSLLSILIPLESQHKKSEAISPKLPSIQDLRAIAIKLAMPVWGKYEEKQMNPEGPYFLFDRNSDLTLIKQMEQIRDEIKKRGSTIAIKYTDTYNYAQTSEISSCEGVIIPNPWDGRKLCNSATRAKASAFVYLVGLKGDGTDLSISDRNGYRDRVITYLKNIKAPGLHNLFDLTSYIPMAGMASSYMGAILQWEQLSYRAKELQMICQAYDMLKWCSKLDPTLSVNNTDIGDAAKRIKTHYVVPLHRRAVAGSYWTHNNYALIIGSSLISAAIAFNDQGTYWMFVESRPQRWASSAYANIHRTMWRNGIFGSKMSTPDGMYGYAEGPYYFSYGFENMLPMILARNNFSNEDVTNKYYPSLLNPFAQRVRNYWYDDDYKNIYRWYNEILQPDNFPPTVDDSWHKLGFNGSLAILRKTNNGKNYNFVENEAKLGHGVHTDLKPDYIAALTPPDITYEPSQSIQFLSGEVVIRNRKKIDTDKHYLYISNEKGSSINGQNHEHKDDQGSFIIMAGEDLLIMDPPYYGDEDKDKVNTRGDHNTLNLTSDFVWTNLSTDYNGEKKLKDWGNTAWYSFTKEFECNSVDCKGSGTNLWQRSYSVIRDDPDFGYYYIVTDKVTLNYSTDAATFSIYLNGNGINSSFSQSNGFFEWQYPCATNLGTNSALHYGLRAQVVTSEPNKDNFSLSENGTHGNKDGTLTSKEIGGSNGYGYHTTLITSVTTNKSFTVTTYLFPRKCNEFGGLQKSSTRGMAERYSMAIVNSGNNFEKYYLHVEKVKNDLDTIIDPFNINPSAILSSDASSVLLNYSTNKMFKSGNCVSNCNFRKASITNGRLLKYHDTTFLTATKFSSSFYELIGKCKYNAYIETDTACSVSFYLADVERGIGMKVKDLTYTYDTNTCIITVSVPVGISQFEIELEDPCRVSCFFPSTAETIHEVFDFNQGVTATLGHKLDIAQPKGLLNITNGSHMILCDGIYLRNRDSLVLNSNCGKDTGQLSISTCDGRVKGIPYGSIGGTGGGAKASKITVNTGAALILENNSFTQISNNSELHVWGSLVIKNGAKLLIGDERTCSYATIMVYPGAYLHIEDSANLEFFKIVGDTQDRHVFFIANKPIGAAVKKGVNPSIINLLQVDTIINATNIPVEICNLSTVTPLHGIANRDWGFCNVLAPVARIKLPSDTICPGECVHINFESSLNDPIRELDVCRIDTILGVATTSCFGAKQLIGGSLDYGYNEGTTCYSTEPNLKVFPLCNFIDSTDHWYKVHVTVKNHCILQDTQTLFFYVGRKPNAIISLTENACPGYGKVTAINHSDINAEKSIWHVHLIDTNPNQDNNENISFYGGDWEVFALHYADTFKFPNFNWIGGFKYAVNLTQIGHCGESFSDWDTVEIQPGAQILASPATVYSDPLGPSALQLNAFIGSATSFNWSPTIYLDTVTSLTPIATPTDTITYILTSYKNNCTAYDTLFIKLNTMAFAGITDTVCNELVLLGTNFDASLFLAYQYSENPIEVWNVLSPYLAIDSTFLDKLSLYFLSSFGKNALQSLPPYSNFLGSFNRNQFYSQSWYPEYFQTYYSNHQYQYAFDIFTQNVRSNPTLAAYIAANPMYNMTFLQTILDFYQNDLYMGNAVQMQTTWEKYTQNGTTWENLGFWENQIKIWDTVTVPTTYKVTVIDNVNGKVEFDQVNIWSDQKLTPGFYVEFQTDSTLYFNNISEPIQSTTTFDWNFGDGTTSKLINPVHTFPFFDSSYVVCLTTTNLCGIEVFCDTIRVDSTGLSLNSKIYKPTKNDEKAAQISIKSGGINLTAFPNPFANEVNIAYQINQEFIQARLRLTDYLGKELQTYTLPNAKGVLVIPFQGLSSGLYTYQLLLDGQLVKTGKIVKD